VGPIAEDLGSALKKQPAHVGGRGGIEFVMRRRRPNPPQAESAETDPEARKVTMLSGQTQDVLGPAGKDLDDSPTLGFQERPQAEASLGQLPHGA